MAKRANYTPISHPRADRDATIADIAVAPNAGQSNRSLSRSDRMAK